MARVSLSRVGTKSEEQEQRYRYLSGGIRLITCWRDTIVTIDIFLTKPNNSTATKDIRSPNTMSSVTCCGGWKNSSSSISVSPTRSWLWQFSVASCIEIKSNTIIVIFEIINGNWGDVVLKVFCFECCNKKGTKISSIKICNRLTYSEHSYLSEIKLLMPEWIDLWQISVSHLNQVSSSGPFENQTPSSFNRVRQKDKCLVRGTTWNRQLLGFPSKISRNCHKNWY